jgi:hypothetical protein
MAMPLSRLGKQIAQVAAALDARGVRFALIDEYFRLFDREPLLDELLRELR